MTEAARSIAEQFRSGDLLSTDLNPNAISRLTILWMGHMVEASWYEPDSPRSVSIDGVAYPSGGDDYLSIIRAAVDRSKALLDQRLRALDAKATGGAL